MGLRFAVLSRARSQYLEEHSIRHRFSIELTLLLMINLTTYTFADLPRRSATIDISDFANSLESHILSPLLHCRKVYSENRSYHHVIASEFGA